MPVFESAALEMSLVGKRIVKASNSLTRFVMVLDDGTGLLLDAVMRDGVPGIEAALISADQLGEEADAVCKVDWSWICSSAIEHAVYGSGQLRLTLEPAGPLSVSVQMWQSKPFLAFQPFRGAKG